jgi:hypothetical protein
MSERTDMFLEWRESITKDPTAIMNIFSGMKNFYDELKDRVKLVEVGLIELEGNFENFKTQVHTKIKDYSLEILEIFSTGNNGSS